MLSAGGVDGWTFKLLLLLPVEIWDQLADLLNLIEAVGTWPPDMHHWKITFIPKEGTGTVPAPEEVRPIAVGAVLYRLWAKLRTDACSYDISATFGTRQGGGKGTFDAETLLSDALVAEDVQNPSFMASYDFLEGPVAWIL